MVIVTLSLPLFPLPLEARSIPSTQEQSTTPLLRLVHFLTVSIRYFFTFFSHHPSFCWYAHPTPVHREECPLQRIMFAPRQERSLQRRMSAPSSRVRWTWMVSPRPLFPPRGLIRCLQDVESMELVLKTSEASGKWTIVNGRCSSMSQILHDADPTLALCMPGRSEGEWLAIDGSRWRTVR